MTLRELLASLGERPGLVAGVLLVPPLLAFVLDRVHARDGRPEAARWPLLDSVLLYASTVPGVFASLLVAYTLLFTGESLLDQDVVLFLLPPATMVATLVLIGRRVAFDRLPGGDRLTAFLALVALSFVLAFGLSRLRIWLVFGGSFLVFVLLAVALFVGLRWTAHRAFGP